MHKTIQECKDSLACKTGMIRYNLEGQHKCNLSNTTKHNEMW